MKDDEYFGFSTVGDYKVVDLPDDGTEDDFKVVDLLNFDTEDDVRIVNLSDVSSLRNVEDEGNRGSNWLDQIDRFDPKAPSLQSFSALKPRCSRRRRVVQSAVVTVLVVTVMLVFVGNFLWIHSIGSMGVQSSTTSASVPVSANPVMAAPAASAPLIIDYSHYYLELSPFLTQILIDGHSLLHIPIPGVDPPLRIFVGKHLVMWRMKNHQTYSCMMSVPPTMSDTCSYDGPESLQNGVAVWIITMPHSNDGTP
jgi:hypothetical protein